MYYDMTISFMIYSLDMLLNATGSQLKKKLNLRGVRQPPSIALRRMSSHAGREKPRTPAPPIHSGTVAHVRTTNDLDRALDLCFGMGQTRGFF